MTASSLGLQSADAAGTMVGLGLWRLNTFMKSFSSSSQLYFSGCLAEFCELVHQGMCGHAGTY